MLGLVGSGTETRGNKVYHSGGGDGSEVHSFAHCLFFQPLRDGSAMHPVFPLEAARDELVGSLRMIIISRLGLTEMEGEISVHLSPSPP